MSYEREYCSAALHWLVFHPVLGLWWTIELPIPEFFPTSMILFNLFFSHTRQRCRHVNMLDIEIRVLGIGQNLSFYTWLLHVNRFFSGYELWTVFFLVFHKYLLRFVFLGGPALKHLTWQNVWCKAFWKVEATDGVPQYLGPRTWKL